MRRSDICIYLGPGNRVQLETLLANRYRPRKLTKRAGIVDATADCVVSVEIKRG